MEFRLLGPVEALVDGAPVQLGGRQRRTILSILLVQLGIPVTTDRLVDELWGERPPEAARKTVQAHIAHLRKALNNGNREVLAAADGGYVLRAEPGSLDTQRFEEAVSAARAVRDSDPEESRLRYEEALSQFGGIPFAGLADNAFSLRVEASRLEELRRVVVEELFDTRLVVGEDASLIPELERQVAENPMRERLWALLMLSLYRSGRQADALGAYNRARQVLAEELGLEPSAELQSLEQRILEHDPTLTNADTVAGAGGAQPPVVRNPYKGLRPFDEADASDFYGRESLVRRLLERIDARPRLRLIVLIGPSGTGKSSVIRAGLVPLLRQRGEAVGLMYPGGDPFGLLTKAVAEATNEAPGDVRERIENAGTVALEPMVLVIDQFEELFTISGNSEDTYRFLEVIARAVSSPESSLWVVVALRADYLDSAMAHPHFASMLEESLVLVPPLTDPEARSVIVEPTAAVGVNIEPELVARLVGGVSSHPAPLPLLQFVLADLFDRRKVDLLALDAYEGMGGVSGALSRRAEEIYDRLDSAGQEATRQMFFRLMEVSDGTRPLRRRVSRDELAALPVDDAVLARVVEDFGRHRLLVFDQDPDTGAAVVEVAHESLLTEWPRLGGWLSAAGEDLGIQEGLSNGTRDWIASGQDPSYLLRGLRLSGMEAWASRTPLMLTTDETRFLVESRRREDAASRQRTRRRRATIGTLAVAALISTIFGVVALGQRQEAQRQTEVAEENFRLARARQLAAAAVANLDEDPQRSILLALESAGITQAAGEGVIRETEEALHQAILESRLRTIITPRSGQGIISSVAAVFSPSGELLAVGAADGITRIYDPTSGEQLDELSGHEGAVIDVKWSSDGSRLLTVGFDGTARLWDVATKEEFRVFGPVGTRALIGSISPDDARVAFSTDDVVGVWDVDSGEELMVIEMPPGLAPVGVAFDPIAGDRVAVATEGPGELGAGVAVFDASTGEEMIRITADDGVCELRWSPDGSRIATASADTTGRVWDAATGELLTSFEKHHSFLCTVDFSPDGRFVVTGGDDGAARIWDAKSGEQIVQLSGHEERVGFASFSPDGRLVVTSSDDDRIRIWDVSPEGRREVVTVSDPTTVVRATYSPDGHHLMTSSFTGSAHIWNASTGALESTLRGHEHWIYTVAFSHDGTTALTGSRDFSARLWDVAAGTEEAVFAAPLPVTAVAFAPDDESVAVATIGGTVHVWDPVSGEVVELADDSSGLGQVFSVDFSPDGSLVAAGGDTIIEVWNPATGRSEASMTISQEFFHSVHSLEFSSDGERILTAHRDGTVRIWDVSAGTQIEQFEGHRGLVWDASFSPDETLVASAAFDGTIRLWSVVEGEEVLLLRDDQAFTSVEFDRRGAHLLVSGDFGARIVVVDEDELIELARSRLLRWWTTEECFQYLGSETCPNQPSDLDSFGS